ncbi:receptor-type tyrosine-protein phosphatase O-like isoform X2 [Brienomyrus brachyistius]|uniref:receptor-type tyrosine-protein phosphatase O-like isoform X2 n=1 Tax=Brienomyrus brachyistius TaxID=42636 RepID=UPI0020B2908B|nr:receptor-type tyrosine-protein phosphatase O-like isoform X2 [Brienomyrus brachyistius]
MYFRGILVSMLPCAICLLCSIQGILSFVATVREDNSILMLLEPADMVDNGTVYGVRVTGEPESHFLLFQNLSDSVPPPLVFNASYHGLCYMVSLMVSNGTVWSKPVKTVSLLTKPLPVYSVFIHDYKPAPETSVIFELKSAENNVFTRVNISYSEGHEQRSMLYKDFFKGKTVFKHWLPGTCYSNITFQLVSEATSNKSTLVQHSLVLHQPGRHRTAPNPPLNVSFRIIRLSRKAAPRLARSGSYSRLVGDVPLIDGQDEVVPMEEEGDPWSFATGQEYLSPTHGSNGSADDSSTSSTRNESSSQAYWPLATASPTSSGPISSEEFVNAPVVESEDQSDSGSGMDQPHHRAPSLPTSGPPHLLLELQWQAPRPPTMFDGFVVNISRNGNDTEVSQVEENTQEFVKKLNEPGSYRVLVTTQSSSGDCEPRESRIDSSFTFYLSSSGEWFEEPKERPQAVTVRMLNSNTAAISWAAPSTNLNGSLVSVLSLTCSKPRLGQRLESNYCNEENTTSDIITDLTPGAQYQVLVFFTNGPLVGPASDPVIISTLPLGVQNLAVHSLSPWEAILSWQRPHNVAFHKYIVETFFFNPATLTSQWSTYYELTATSSLVASVRVTDLLPAWYYKFRVTMETWGEPARSCCDRSTVSFITAPEAPHISLVEYFSSVLHVRWTYGDIFTDLSHSRMLHWQVAAEGMRGARRRASANVPRTAMQATLALPPGDIYNLTVTACTERSNNTSTPHIIKLEPARPKSLYAVNTTHTSVSLLWVEEGIVDFYRVSCKQVGLSRSTKGEREAQTVHSHVATVSNLLPATTYNCSVTSYSYSTPSEPAYVAISTQARELNPSVAAISALAVLSVLLISLLLFILIVLRKKHIQMSRECGAGTFVNFASFERDGKLPYNWSKTALKKRKLTCPVQLDDFDTYISDMTRDSAYKFSLQFEELKSVGLDLSHEAADLAVNRSKNRYTNILPYDFSRVKLLSMQNEEGSDYINANYIPGYKGPREYIATQGPLPETRDDFWKMVLQQKCRIIVMLTQCNERRRVKCDHYWPYTDVPVTYGEITVEMLSEKESPEWTVRNFRLSCADETQDVLHLNYTSWPDHGVPTINAIESILQFVHIARQQAVKLKGPIIVHCSAGVGRTGTFIALDRLMQHMREHEFVDVLGLVAEMRAHRLCMVQTEEQYVFIHQCVQLMWRKKQQTVTGDVVYENVIKS